MAPLFVDDPAFDRSTQGFGWSDGACAYTHGCHFTAPTGLDAILLFYRAKQEEREQTGLSQRGVLLLTFAMGRIVERMAVASCMTLSRGKELNQQKDLPSLQDTSFEEIPAVGDYFDISLSWISQDGGIRTRHVCQWSGRKVDEITRWAILQSYPRFTVLERVRVEEGGRTYAFTDTEIAQLEAAITEQRGFTEMILPVIVEAVHMKYGDMTDGAWQLVAGALGIPVKSAKRKSKEHDDWWAGYTRMHDGEPPS
jgi:predicted Fe-S protein YdhL (DUF1289 family)